LRKKVQQNLQQICNIPATTLHLAGAKCKATAAPLPVDAPRLPFHGFLRYSPYCMLVLRVLSIALILSISLAPNVVRAEKSLTADEVITKAVAHAQSETHTGPQNYAYTKVTVADEIDGSGKVKDHKEKLYQVRFQEGITTAKLISVNGRYPESSDLKKVSENESNFGKMTGHGKRARTDDGGSFLTSELAARFSYRLAGQETINGRLAYQIAFQPASPEPPVHNLVDRLLNRISGSLWIDADEFELVRSDIQLRSEVDFLAGVIGVLRKFDYSMTRTRMADGVWLNTDSSGEFEGRKLLDSKRLKTQTHIKNFHPLPDKAPSLAKAAG